MPWWRLRTAEQRPPRWLTAGPYAHRGLHGPGRPENSFAAFRAAMDSGEGIELDVQACRGGDAVVFHDATLERLCGRPGSIAKLTADQLARFTLADSSEAISTLDDALALIDGRARLLIEIKARRLGHPSLCRSVASSLSRYRGPVAVMSFSVMAMLWFRRHAPQIVRGLVISEEGGKSLLPRRLAFHAVRADFLAYDVRSLPSRFASGARAAGIPILSWTVRNDEERDRARHQADQIIHELR